MDIAGGGRAPPEQRKGLPQMTRVSVTGEYKNGARNEAT